MRKAKEEILEKLLNISDSTNLQDLEKFQEELQLYLQNKEDWYAREMLNIVKGYIFANEKGDLEKGYSVVKESLERLADKQGAWDIYDIYTASCISYYAITFEEAYSFTQTTLKHLDALTLVDHTKESIQVTLYTNLTGRILSGKYLDPHYVVQKQERDQIFKEYIQKALSLCTKNGWSILLTVNLVRKGLFEEDDNLVWVGLDSLQHRDETGWCHILKRDAKKYKESDINSRRTIIPEQVNPQTTIDAISESNEVARVLPDNLEKYVAQILVDFGVSRHLKGYTYLRDAIIMSIKDPILPTSFTGRLYPVVADKHNTTVNAAERAIRTAIESAWENGGLESLNSMFGNNITASTKKRPTNAALIKMLVDVILLDAKDKVK